MPVVRLAQLIVEAKSGPFSYASTQVDIPLIGLPATGFIKDADLYPGEAEGGIENEPHVTVLYGLLTEDPDEVEAVVQGFGPVTLRLDKTIVFRNDKATQAQQGADYEVVVLAIKSPDLERLHTLIAYHLDYENDRPYYVPHLTVAYVQPGCGAAYEGRVVPGFTGREFRMDTLTFCSKTGDPVSISLI